MTAIKRCTCKHEFQDKIYGLGMRVMNYLSKKTGNAQVVRCTVCGKEHQL